MIFFRSPAGSAIVAFIALAAGGADIAEGSRVLGTDGTLRGYRWGLTVKRQLLDHEASA